MLLYANINCNGQFNPCSATLQARGINIMEFQLDGSSVEIADIVKLGSFDGIITSDKDLADRLSLDYDVILVDGNSFKAMA